MLDGFAAFPFLALPLGPVPLEIEQSADSSECGESNKRVKQRLVVAIEQPNDGLTVDVAEISQREESNSPSQ